VTSADQEVKRIVLTKRVFAAIVVAVYTQNKLPRKDLKQFTDKPIGVISRVVKQVAKKNGNQRIRLGER